jgi:uncharacterized damage-inducible protein DinB
MITPDYVRAMADYNRWQNENLYGAAGTLCDEDRKMPRGAFFGSIHATLNHLLWADQMWMSRFEPSISPPPGKRPSESTTRYAVWDELVSARQAFDARILDWSSRVDPAWLDGDLTWFSGAAGREMSKPRGLLVAHMFNHQTHHRGQVHCMLTQAGVKPGDTDLSFRAA